MNGFEKECTLHVRVSKNEIINYKKLASEMGMNISTLTRENFRRTEKEVKVVYDNLDTCTFLLYCIKNN